MTDDIPFNLPYRAPGELEKVREALASGQISGDGPFTKQASALLKEQLGGAEVLLTTSGTHALELGALLLDLGPEDEVVMPSFTFPSTANAVALRGAHIRFADIDRDTFSMELPEIQAAATARTTCVILMHYGGVSRDAVRAIEWCTDRGIQVMEDAAHALFASLDGRPFGTLARVAALSFHSTKNVSGGECGALVLNDPSLLPRAQILREKGTDRSRFLRGEVDKYTWQEAGSSYLPSDILAALLCSQLEAAEVIQARRHAIWNEYRELLAPAVKRFGLRLQTIPEGCDHPAHTFAFLLPRGVVRESLIKALLQRGIHVHSHYEPLHRAPGRLRVPGGADSEALPVTDDVAARLVRLPLFASMTAKHAVRVVEAVVAALEELQGRAK